MVSRRGFSLLELAVVLTVSMLLVGAVLAAFRAVMDQGDQVLADQTLDRVLHAQVAYATGHGRWAVSTSADDGVLATALPQLDHDLDLTHGRSTGVGSVSVAVGVDGTLVLAHQLADRSCRWLSVPSVTTPEAQTFGTEAGPYTCRAASLLPAGEPAVWE